MATQIIQKDLNFAYENIEKAIQESNRAVFKYEVFISDDQHSSNENYIVGDVDNYLLKIKN